MSLRPKPEFGQKGSVKRLGSGSGDWEILFYTLTRVASLQAWPRLMRRGWEDLGPSPTGLLLFSVHVRETWSLHKRGGKGWKSKVRMTSQTDISVTLKPDVALDKVVLEMELYSSTSIHTQKTDRLTRKLSSQATPVIQGGKNVAPRWPLWEITGQ